MSKNDNTTPKAGVNGDTPKNGDLFEITESQEPSTNKTPFIDLWEDTKPVAPTAADSPLRLLWVRDEPVVITPFSQTAIPVDIHWHQFEDKWDRFRCNGDTCAFCLAKRKQERLMLVPVFDPAAREILILPIPDDDVPGSLLAEIRTFFNPKSPHKLIQIVRLGKRRHVISAMPTENLDLGVDIIREFVDRMNAISAAELTEYYRGSYQSVSNATLLRDYPELKRTVEIHNPTLDLSQL
jgi:hypothetical protein